MYKKITIFLLLIAIVMPMVFLGGVYADDLDADGLFKDGEFDVRIDKNGNVIVDATEDRVGAWSKLLERYKGFITGVSAIGAVTMVVLFILQFIRLGTSAGNSKARAEALVGVLWTGIAAAGLGAVAVITGIFYRAI